MKFFKTISDAVPETQYQYVFSGSESDCYLNKENSKILRKLTLPWDEMFDLEESTNIHNELFPETSYTIIGYVENPWREGEVFRMVRDQDYFGEYQTLFEYCAEKVQNNSSKSSELFERLFEQLVVPYMLAKGCVRDKGAFIYKNYRIDDLKDQNIMINDSQEVIVIDCLINKLKQ
ncbi:MAG: hypothetical protein LBS01_07285 [Prevotellaceae bacterium]|jgi:hypothetical protein|nr:hypothetical protein [Prevotellaceae bacterium]